VKSYEKLLLENKAWAQQRLASDRRYFERLAQGDHPQFLWIGSADSRVPPHELTGTEPGEMLVHRNIANLVVHTDFNLMSVLQHAVEVLQVQHIIVCGHYGCSGVNAALSSSNLGMMNKWLRHIKDVARLRRADLEPFRDRPVELAKRLVEVNVEEQVENLSYTSIVQRAWKHRGEPILHGWVYNLDDGRLKDLVRHGPEDQVEPLYRFSKDELV
jgi:carbonic anhydrase